MCQGRNPRKLPVTITARIITGHSSRLLPDLKERMAMVALAITTTPESCPSTPFAPKLSPFIRKTIQKIAKPFAIIGDRFIIPPVGFVMNVIPMPVATGINAAMNCMTNLRYGLKLYLSSRSPVIKIIVALTRIAKR